MSTDADPSTEPRPSSQQRAVQATGETFTSRYRNAIDGLRRAQKPGSGVPAYTRWVNRGLARYVAAVAFASGIGPNGVTLGSAAASSVGVVVMLSAPVTAASGIAIALLLAFGYLLDSADGQVARLSRRGSLAGEWLDHVVDAVRTPTIHLAVLLGLWRDGIAPDWFLLVPLVYCVVAVGQFMSQILAEQLARSKEKEPDGSGVLQSFVLIPTDTGVLCLVFLSWGFTPVFAVLYGALFVLNFVHTGVSMRRKYRKLIALHR